MWEGSTGGICNGDVVIVVGLSGCQVVSTYITMTVTTTMTTTTTTTTMITMTTMTTLI